MKKITSVMMLAAAAAAALVSCNKEIEKPEVPQESEGIKVTIVTGEPETKTVLESNGKSVSWAGTDKVGFFNHTDGVNVQSSAAVIDGDGKATFTATVPAAGTYYAYYPYQADGSYAPDTDGVTVRILNTQSPTPTSFDPATDLLVSTSFEATGATDTPASIQFKRLGAFIKVQFSDKTTGNKLAGEYASSVSIQADTKIVGRLKISGKSEGQLIDPDSGYQKVTANYDAHTYEVLNAEHAAYFGIKPVTLAKDSKLIVTLTTGKYNISKTLTLKKDAVIKAGNVLPITVTLNDADVKLRSMRQWGWYSGDKLWTNNVTAISVTHNDGYGMVRSLAMDDEYIYLPKSSSYANIAAVKITDAHDQLAGTITGINGGSTFKTSFVRVIKNTDAGVNGGKDILLLCNLTATDSDANQLRVYAYENGIGAAPKQIAGFCWDSANNVNDWRRYGDRFYVTGTYQDGKLYFPSFNANKTVILSIANGARTAVTQIAAGAASPEGIKDVTVYPGDNKLFFTNASVANLVAPTGGKSNGWDEYSLSKSCDVAIGTWGYNFFEFNGQNYIAYARTSGNKAWVEIIEDKGDLISSLEAQAGLVKSPIHSATDLDADHATGGLADCCVRVIGGEVYIAALTRDGGLIVDKISL